MLLVLLNLAAAKANQLAQQNFRQDYKDLIELQQLLGMTFTPASMGLETIDADGRTVAIDHDSQFTSFLRKSIERVGNLPERDFELDDRDRRKRQGRRDFFILAQSA